MNLIWSESASGWVLTTYMFKTTLYPDWLWLVKDTCTHSVPSSRCTIIHWDVPDKLFVNLLPQPGYLTQNQLSKEAPQCNKNNSITQLKSDEPAWMLCPAQELWLYIFYDTTRVHGARVGCVGVHCHPLDLNGTGHISRTGANGWLKWSRRLTPELTMCVTMSENIRFGPSRSHGPMTNSVQLNDVHSNHYKYPSGKLCWEFAKAPLSYAHYTKIPGTNQVLWGKLWVSRAHKSLPKLCGCSV